MTTTQLEFVSITKSFERRPVLHAVSLAVAKGEFFSIVGASGCGKSTLLRIAAGHETADAGRIVLGGADVTTLPPWERPVNMMFQSYALFPHLTVRRNIEFGLHQERLAPQAIAERSAHVMDQLAISGLAERMPRRLSGGERQRVALARAIVKRPPILLLDEPLSALDAHLKEKARHELADLRDSLGITFIMVTHDQADALSMSDRIAVMGDGRVEQIGSPQEVYDAPKNAYVASFLGETNFFSGRVISTTPFKVRDDSSAKEFVLGQQPEFETHEGSITFVVRPERITVSGQASNTINAFEGTITDVEFLGSNIRYRLQIHQQRDIVADVARTADPPFKKGQQAHISWTPDAAHALRP